MSISGQGGARTFMRSALLYFFLALSPAATLYAADLAISNNTEDVLINIQINPEDKSAQPFFIRLDLFPGNAALVDNPGIYAAMRVDTGLQFWNFPAVDFGSLKSMDFCPDGPACVKLVGNDAKEALLKGQITELAPQKGDRPVCELTSFHPAMPMRDVCAILPTEMPRDDNGAVLTGLGFAGMTWASRLIPAQDGPISDNTLLDHMELRRRLSHADLARLLNALFKQGYVPWQAEFPGQDIEFDEITSMNGEQKQSYILKVADAFISSHNPASHKNHKNGGACAQASILMAPASLLPMLDNADEPDRDVQLFTVYLRPCSGTLLLDVAAYRNRK